MEEPTMGYHVTLKNHLVENIRLRGAKLKYVP